MDGEAQFLHQECCDGEAPVRASDHGHSVWRLEVHDKMAPGWFQARHLLLACRGQALPSPALASSTHAEGEGAPVLRLCPRLGPHMAAVTALRLALHTLSRGGSSSALNLRDVVVSTGAPSASPCRASALSVLVGKVTSVHSSEGL